MLQASTAGRFPTVAYALKVSFVKMQRPQIGEQPRSLESWGRFMEQVLSSREERRERFGTLGNGEVQKGGRCVYCRRGRKGKGRTLNRVLGTKLTGSETKDGKSQWNKHCGFHL